MTDFRELGLSEQTIQSLAAMGFEEPTPVQVQAIPRLLEGKDVIAQALTGTGKTAAYGVPIAERVDITQAVPQAIVLTPTRELAIQVTDHLAKIGRDRRIAVVPIYGGQPIWRQLQTLQRGVQVIVATPGRLLDHLRRGSVDLSTVKLLVLDEADQMLEMGFIEDVQFVLDRLPADRVSALFSATMPRPIVELAHQYLREPEHIRLSQPNKLTVPEIDQAFYIVPYVHKLDALCRVLDVRQPDRTIVFCSTKRTVDDVVEGLGARGYQSEAIHGDITQVMRERVLRSFRAGQTEVLVATDVAARGIDVPEVSHVINFDLPPDPEYYVHRIGRTGRSGRSGVAITFVNPREMRALKIIERATGAHIRREEVPSAAEVEEREAEMLRERLLSTLAKGGWGRYRAIVEELFEEHDAIDVAAAALSLAGSIPGAARRISTGPADRLALGRPAPAIRAPERESAGTDVHERPASDEGDRPAPDLRERSPLVERPIPSLRPRPAPAGRQAPSFRARPAPPDRDRAGAAQRTGDRPPRRQERGGDAGSPPQAPAQRSRPPHAGATPVPGRRRSEPVTDEQWLDRLKILVDDDEPSGPGDSDSKRVPAGKGKPFKKAPGGGKGSGKGAAFGKPRRPTITFGKAGPRRGSGGPRKPGSGPKRRG